MAIWHSIGKGKGTRDWPGAIFLNPRIALVDLTKVDSLGTSVRFWRTAAINVIAAEMLSPLKYKSSMAQAQAVSTWFKVFMGSLFSFANLFSMLQASVYAPGLGDVLRF